MFVLGVTQYLDNVIYLNSVLLLLDIQVISVFFLIVTND